MCPRVSLQLIQLPLNLQVRNKIHPTSIISGYRLAMRESCKYIQDHLAMKTDKLGKVRCHAHFPAEIPHRPLPRLPLG